MIVHKYGSGFYLAVVPFDPCVIEYSPFRCSLSLMHRYYTPIRGA